MKRIFIDCDKLPIETQAKIELNTSDVIRGEPGMALKYAIVREKNNNYTALKKDNDIYAYNSEEIETTEWIGRGTIVNLSWPEGAPSATMTKAQLQKLDR